MTQPRLIDVEPKQRVKPPEKQPRCQRCRNIAEYRVIGCLLELRCTRCGWSREEGVHIDESDSN